MQFADLWNEPFWLIALFAAAAVLGAFIGMISLGRRARSWWLFFVSPFIGMLAGEVSLVILLAPGALWRTVVAITVLLAAAICIKITAD
ncbi:MAG: hypothetical protein U0805_17750 [Pirellulales bacterium]